jgi:uncharacterized protein involved in outer membrane biogenesis
MKRSTKRWLILLGIPLLLIVGGIVALKLILTGDRLRAMILPRVEASLGRPVAVGDVSFSLFPSLGITLDSLQIMNPPKGRFSGTPLLLLERGVVDVRLMPLLKGSVEVTTLSLKGPRLWLETDSAGNANYTMAEPAGGGAARPDTGASAFSGHVSVPEIRIVDGTIEYVNLQSGSAMGLDDVDLTLSADIPEGGSIVDTRISGTAGGFRYGPRKSPLIQGLPLGLEQRLVYYRAADSLALGSGAVTLRRMQLSTSGSVARASADQYYDLKISGDRLTVADLLSLIPPEYMKQAAGMDAGGDVQAVMHIVGTVTDSTLPAVTGTVRVNNGMIKYTQLPKAITGIALSASFERSGAKEEFVVDRFSARMGSNPIDARLRVVDFDDPAIALNVRGSLNLSELPQYYPVEQGTEVSGFLSADVDIAGTVAAPKSMRASGTMTLRGVSVKTAAAARPLENLEGTLVFTNERLEGRKFSMTLGRSDVALDFRMDNYLAMAMPEASAGRPRLSGSLVSRHLYAADLTEQPQPDTQAGRTAARSTSNTGSLPDLDADLSARIGILTMEQMELRDLAATVELRNSVLTLRTLTAKAFDGDVTTRGTIRMTDPAKPEFDLTLDVSRVSANSLLSTFTSFSDRLFGALSMKASMSGALNDTMGLVPSTVNGTGTVSIQAGRLAGVKINKAISELLRLPDLEEIKFKDWSNSFSVVAGRLQLKDLVIASSDADYVVNGSQGMDGSLDYGVTVLLSSAMSSRVALKGLAGEAVQALKNPDGRLPLNLKVAGTTASPQVTLDTAELERRLQDKAKEKVAGEAKKLQDDLQKKANDLLKDLFKKKK